MRSYSLARTSVTSRDSTETPGSSTRSRSIHTTARSNNARRDSTGFHTREATGPQVLPALGELAVPQQLPDLPRVLVMGRQPIRVQLQTARVLDVELFGQELGDNLRHVAGRE